ncbi:hypothetical protein ACQX4I_05045 [Corynebacterium diphtheriae]|nr:hypothetical protein [Corynebacterium diphtheriae]
MANIENWVQLSSGKDGIVTVIFDLLKQIAKMSKAIAELIGLAK